MEEERRTEQSNQENNIQSTGPSRLERAVRELQALLTFAVVTAGAMVCLAIVSQTPVIGAIVWNTYLVAVASALYVLPGASSRLEIEGTFTVWLARAFREGIRAPHKLIPDLIEWAAKVHKLGRSLRYGSDAATRSRR